MNNLKGMSAEVLRGRYESTNNGISSKYDDLILVGEGVFSNYEGNENNDNVVKIVKRFIGGRDYFHVEPVNGGDSRIGGMFGGNYLNAVGSLYGDIDYPLPIHDRFETQKEYNSLSK